MALWIAGIFYFSSRPEPLFLVATNSSGTEVLDGVDPSNFPVVIESSEKEQTVSILNPLAHFAEYAGLAFLLIRAFASGAPNRRRAPGTLLAAVLIVAAIALTDELYQQTVPDRGFELFDVLSDIAGGLSATALLWIRNGIR